jgi:acyl homoserine lactone synthase
MPLSLQIPAWYQKNASSKKYITFGAMYVMIVSKICVSTKKIKDQGSDTMGYVNRGSRTLKGRDVFPVLRPAETDDLISSRAVAFLQERLKVGRSPSKKLGEKNGRIRATVLSVGNAHLHGELYGDFLRARKQVFIDTKSWDLPQVEGMEFDQYDTPQSKSIVLHEYGEILAGIRILPTRARCGCYSYMLRDAQLGVIDTIPPHVLFEKAPDTDYIWEATRLFICPSVPAKRRSLIQSRLMLEMAAAAVNEGATHVIGIVPHVYVRWLERIGLDALPIGPKIAYDDDTSQAAMMHVAGVGTI